MNTKLAACVVVLGAFAVAARAVPNTVVNGDFAAAGVLAPWTAPSGAPVVSGGVCVLDNASIQQTVATTAGGRYYLSFIASGFGTVSFSAGPAAGGASDVSGTAFPFGAKTSRIFNAGSAATKLAFSATSGGVGFSSSVDDVRLVELTPNALAGTYAGTVAESVALTDHPLGGAGATRKVRAIVDADGKLYVLDGVTVFCSGMLFSDGTFSVRARDSFHDGSAVVKGKRVEITFADPMQAAQDEGGNPIAGVVTTKLTLKRTGNFPKPK